MTNKSSLWIALAVCALSPWIDATAIGSCFDHQNCLEFSEGACVGGLRQICLRKATGFLCQLNIFPAPNSYTSMCALNAFNGVQSSGTDNICFTYAGGSTAIFRVDGGQAASNQLPVANLREINSNSFRTASCSAPGNRICSSFSTEAEWRIGVTPCGCECTDFTPFLPCNCPAGTSTRTRTCLNTAIPGVCPTSETISCPCTTTTTPAVPTAPTAPTAPTIPPSGCVCSTTWSEWTQCSSSCIGGTRQRVISCTRVNSFSACNNIVETQPCGSVDCSAVNCLCDAWMSGGCSVTCGTGTQVLTRRCSGSCSASTSTRIEASCQLAACPTVQPGDRCRLLPTRRQRIACRRTLG